MDGSPFGVCGWVVFRVGGGRLWLRLRGRGRFARASSLRGGFAGAGAGRAAGLLRLRRGLVAARLARWRRCLRRLELRWGRLARLAQRP